MPSPCRRRFQPLAGRYCRFCANFAAGPDNDSHSREPGADEKAPSGYSFVSVEYTDIEKTPLEVLTEELSCENDGDDYSIRFFEIHTHAPLNVVFSMPERELKHSELLKNVRAPLPVLDDAGELGGLSDQTLYLKFDGGAAGAAVVVCCSDISIPPRTAYTLSTRFLGWRVTARYRCTVENDDTEERVTFSGAWSGESFHTVETRFIDAQGEVIKTAAQPVEY